MSTFTFSPRCHFQHLPVIFWAEHLIANEPAYAEVDNNDVRPVAGEFVCVRLDVSITLLYLLGLQQRVCVCVHLLISIFVS